MTSVELPNTTTIEQPHEYDHRGLIMFGIMMVTALAAIEGTIVATALPSVVRDFGSFNSFPWVFSMYLLTQAVSVPFYGRLADTRGRRPVLIAGVMLFIAASLLCGIAWSMGSLIAFRALQGLGAGVVFPVTQTIMGDMFNLQERAKAQGLTASVWAVSSVLGPALGGLFSEQLSWRWIFYINVPFGLLGLALIARFLVDPPRLGVQRRLDVKGGALLLVGTSTLTLALLEGGTHWAWSSAASLSLFAAAAISLAWCWRIEGKVADPILPPWVFTRLPILSANIVSFVVGAIVLGLTAFFPIYAQNVLGVGPTVAGFGLAAALLGWPVAASMSGKLYLKHGFRSVATAGAMCAIVGGAWLVLLGDDMSVLTAAAGNFLIGIGLGLMSTSSMISVQNAVGWSERGAVTGASMFARTLGSALGTAILGAIFHVATRGIEHPPMQLIALGAHRVFASIVILGVIALIAATKMPRQAVEARR
jgi:EmrB/QacA subfamily drug resistance transporter